MNYSVEKLMNDVEEVVTLFLKDETEMLSDEEYDRVVRYIDRRSINKHDFYYSEDFIAIRGESSIRTFDYYAGGEYVKEFEIIGDLKIYSGEDGRIGRIIDAINSDDFEDEEE